MISLKDRAAIVGIGQSEYSRKSDLTLTELLLQAALRAIEDAGLTPKDIDGVIPGLAPSPPMEEYVDNLGIEDLRYTSTHNFGGASPLASLQSAALAVSMGVAQYVLCVSGRKGSNLKIFDLKSRVGFWTLPHQIDFDAPFGSVIMMQRYGTIARRHMHEYGTTTRQFGAVAVAAHKHAMLNEKAVCRELITIENHQKSEMLVDPFRRLDIALERSDGTAAFIVTTAERARHMKQRPVYVMGIAEGHGDLPDQITNRRVITDMGVKKAAPRAFAMAGITPADVNFAEIYDSSTFLAICQLEDVGFCKKGEGGPFVEGGRIELGGGLPINTHGGCLAEVNMAGMNHVIEAVRQLRGTAGAAQVKDAEIGVVTGNGNECDGAIGILRR